MDDTIDAEKIELFTKDKNNILSLDATKDNHKVRLATEQGAMEIKAAKTIMVESEDSQIVNCGKDHQIVVENRQRLMTKNKQIEQIAATDIVKKAGDNIIWSSDTGNTELDVGNDMIVEVGNNCSFEVKTGDMSFSISSGKFEVQAAKAITLKGDGGGPISIKQSGAKIEISPAGMIDIEGTTVNIDAGSLLLKGGMMTHVPGGGAGGAGAAGSGGSGSADFTQSEIGRYAGFEFNPEAAASSSVQKSPAVTNQNASAAITATKGAVKTPVLPNDPQVVSAAWAKPRVEVGTAIDMAFTAMNFKGGEAVKIKVYEYDKNGMKDLVDTMNTKLKTGSGQFKATWTRSAQQANQDLAQDQQAGDTGPLEYRFEVEITGSKATKLSGKLNLTKTVEVEILDDSEIPVPDGLEIILTDAEDKKHSAKSSKGLAVFKTILVGPISISVEEAGV